ncbi:MAG: hypothetical protein BZ137_09565 [Methanosphaera sp. rholeuAM130]|nr:MAG: hypothetical protein BZ137_09565 [Methanosphaera sp. rholeuAM130]
MYFLLDIMIFIYNVHYININTINNILIIMLIESNNLNLNENLYEVARLDEKQLNNINFDSEDDDLNDFLFNESLDYCKENLAIVYLVYQEEDVLGYFSLSADSVKINEKLDIKLKYYPSLKIGRLAVDKKFKGNGIGSWIIDWVIGYVLKNRSGHGIRFVSVDAYNKINVIKFYESKKFTIYNKKKKKNQLNIPMYLDINED